MAVNELRESSKRRPLSIRLGERLMDFSRPRVMGIVNATPDSFWAGSRCGDAADIASLVEGMLSEGADIIDLGGCSTRPGSPQPSEREETERLDRALDAIRGRFPDAVVSVDTYRSRVARRCVERWHADIINDISGGDLDPEMTDTVAELGVPFVAMHMRGTPETMTGLCRYGDVTAEVLEDLARKAGRLHQAGVADVIVDPGFGFAKNADLNFEMLSRLEVFRRIGCPLLVGISRKRMIWQTLGTDAAGALNGTTVLNTIALLGGADILRVHDVRAAREAVTLVEAMRRNAPADRNTITRYYPSTNPQTPSR